MLNKISRRELLKVGLVATGGVLAACAPKIVKETVIVEKEVEKVVKETVVVKEAVEVEKEVTRVIEVDKAAEKAAALKAALVWDTFRGIGSGWNEERITTFKDKFPSVSIDFRPLGGGQQENYAKMYAMFAAGDLGDICGWDPSHYHYWRSINKGIVLPLKEMMDVDGLNLKEWFDAFISIQWYKGEIYGLPSWGWTGYDDFVTNFLHFEEEGITPPDPLAHDTSMDTIAEWAHTFRKVNAAGQVERYGLSLSWGEAGVVVLCRAFNSYLLNEDGTKCLLLDSEGSRQAMKWAYDLAVVDKVTPAPGDLSGGNQAAWAAGKLTMYHCGSLCVINANKALTDPSLAKIGQTLFPTRKDGKFPTQLRGGNWCVNKTSKYPEAGYEFVKHLSGKDGTIGFNLVGGNGALTRPDVLPVLAASNPLYAWFVDNLKNGIPARTPVNSRGREYTDAVGQWTAKMMDPKEVVPFEKGLQDLNDNIQKVLDQPMP